MKSNKLTATVLAILSLCFPLCACADDSYTFVDPIEYVEGTPICEWEMGEVYRIFDEYCDFDDCAKIYAKNYKGNRLCLLNANNNNLLQFKTCYVLDKDRNNDNLYFISIFTYYDEELGAPPKATEKYSFACEIYIKPLTKEFDKNKLSFQFVKENSLECKFSHKFANIFMGDECFATFFFGTRVPITQEWFENFLTKYLVWGDSLVYEETENFGGEE